MAAKRNLARSRAQRKRKKEEVWIRIAPADITLLKVIGSSRTGN